MLQFREDTSYSTFWFKPHTCNFNRAHVRTVKFTLHLGFVFLIPTQMSVFPSLLVIDSWKLGERNKNETSGFSTIPYFLLLRLMLTLTNDAICDQALKAGRKPHLYLLLNSTLVLVENGDADRTKSCGIVDSIFIYFFNAPT